LHVRGKVLVEAAKVVVVAGIVIAVVPNGFLELVAAVGVVVAVPSVELSVNDFVLVDTRTKVDVVIDVVVSDVVCPHVQPRHEHSYNFSTSSHDMSKACQ
jgi:hypothetical protein